MIIECSKNDYDTYKQFEKVSNREIDLSLDNIRIWRETYSKVMNVGDIGINTKIYHTISKKANPEDGET